MGGVDGWMDGWVRYGRRTVDNFVSHYKVRLIITSMRRRRHCATRIERNQFRITLRSMKTRRMR